jgi:ABC-type transport system substrate-binding protein
MLGGLSDVEFRGRTPTERDQLLRSPDPDRSVVHEGPWATVDIVIFNTTHKPVDDPRMRRRLSLAIDRCVLCSPAFPSAPALCSTGSAASATPRWGGNEALSKITFVKAAGGFLRPGYNYALPEALATHGRAKHFAQHVDAQLSAFRSIADQRPPLR